MPYHLTAQLPFVILLQPALLLTHLVLLQLQATNFRIIFLLDLKHVSLIKSMALYTKKYTIYSTLFNTLNIFMELLSQWLMLWLAKLQQH
jgi:hypothetical protein